MSVWVYMTPSPKKANSSVEFVHEGASILVRNWHLKYKWRVQMKDRHKTHAPTSQNGSLAWIVWDKALPRKIKCSCLWEKTLDSHQQRPKQALQDLQNSPWMEYCDPKSWELAGARSRLTVHATLGTEALPYTTPPTDVLHLLVHHGVLIFNHAILAK